MSALGTAIVAIAAALAGILGAVLFSVRKARQQTATDEALAASARAQEMRQQSQAQADQARMDAQEALGGARTQAEKEIADALNRSSLARYLSHVTARDGDK